MKMHLKRNEAWEYVLNLIDSRCGSVACSCEHGSETAGSITGGEFLSPLINCEFVKDYALLSYVFVAEIFYLDVR
jgi:hypothetical protein